MKKFLFILLVSFSPIVSFSQKDTSNIKYIGDEKKIVPSSFPIRAINTDTKIVPPTDIDINTTHKISEKTISNSIKNHKPISNHPFVMENLPKDKDILVKKYWMGNDVSETKLESQISLGTINSTSKKVKIECRDYSYVDGDRIRIFLNEKVITSNLTLDGNYFFVYITLEPGYNRIDFQALNQGLSGPNTAELIVYDESGIIISAKEWNLLTGAIATLGIIKK